MATPIKSAPVNHPGDARKVSTPPRPKVRPEVDLCKRGEERIDRFLEAATQVFLEKGYRHARLSEIVSRAGGSLATLYRAFGDKEGLAHAIIERQAEKFTLVFLDATLVALPPEKGLYLLARRFVETMVSVESQVLHRTIIGEGHSFPELRDWYFEHAVGPTNHTIAQYLQQQASAGHLVLPQGSETAATQLVMLMVGDLILRMASGHLATVDRIAADAAARAGVELFLRSASCAAQYRTGLPARPVVT